MTTFTKAPVRKALITVAVALCMVGVGALAAGCAPSGNSDTDLSNTGAPAAESGAVPTTMGIHEGVVNDCTACHEGSDPAAYTYDPGVTDEKCMSCHGDHEALAELTPLDGVKQYNPHWNHFTEELACATCHSNHPEQGASEFWCTSCHMGYQAPEGWECPEMGDTVPKYLRDGAAEEGEATK